MNQLSAARTPKPSSPSRWPTLLGKFHADLKLTSRFQLSTWKDNHAPFLDLAVELLGGARAPVDARELLGQVVSHWNDKPPLVKSIWLGA